MLISVTRSDDDNDHDNGDDDEEKWRNYKYLITLSYNFVVY